MGNGGGPGQTALGRHQPWHAMLSSGNGMFCVKIPTTKALRSLIWPFLRSEVACRLVIRSLPFSVPVERSCSVPYSGFAGPTRKKLKDIVMAQSRLGNCRGGGGEGGTLLFRQSSSWDTALAGEKDQPASRASPGVPLGERARLRSRHDRIRHGVEQKKSNLHLFWAPRPARSTSSPIRRRGKVLRRPRPSAGEWSRCCPRDRFGDPSIPDSAAVQSGRAAWACCNHDSWGASGAVGRSECCWRCRLALNDPARAQGSLDKTQPYSPAIVHPT